jgi:hypothetical protein
MLTFAPLGALADDTATAPPADANAATPARLGPQSTGPGGSNADASALQPAGLAPLQSTAGDSTGLTAPQNALQAPVTADAALTVLSGETDVSTREAGEAEADPLWSWIGLLLALGLLAASAVVIRDRRRFRP